MRNVSSFNDITDRDMVMSNWKEIKRKANERHISKVVKHVLKLSLKDVAFLICVGLWLFSLVFTVVTIARI